MDTCSNNKADELTYDKMNELFKQLKAEKKKNEDEFMERVVNRLRTSSIFDVSK